AVETATVHLVGQLARGHPLVAPVLEDAHEYRVQGPRLRLLGRDGANAGFAEERLRAVDLLHELGAATVEGLQLGAGTRQRLLYQSLAPLQCVVEFGHGRDNM